MNSKEMWGRVKAFLDDVAKNPAASFAVGAGGGALAGKALGVGAGKGATAGALLALLNNNMSLSWRSDDLSRRSDEIARRSDDLSRRSDDLSRRSDEIERRSGEWVDRINKRIDNKARNSMLRDAALTYLALK